MSILYSLTVFLLCVCFHASNARSLGAIGLKEAEEKFLHPNKHDEKVSHIKISVTPKLKPSLSKHTRVEDKDHHHKPRNSKAKQLKNQGMMNKTPASSKTDDDQSLVSVSWLSSHRKRGSEKQPGFHLDYAPPETHPPVNN